jgi:hypothetical protein
MKEVCTTYDLSDEQLIEVNGGSLTSLYKHMAVYSVGHVVLGPIGGSFAVGVYRGYKYG